VPSNEENVATKLQRIAEKASSAPEFQFTSLFHLMNEELLLGCFERLTSTLTQTDPFLLTGMGQFR